MVLATAIQGFNLTAAFFLDTSLGVIRCRRVMIIHRQCLFRMAVDIQEVGAIISFVCQMYIADIVIKKACFGMAILLLPIQFTPCLPCGRFIEVVKSGKKINALAARGTWSFDHRDLGF